MLEIRFDTPGPCSPPYRAAVDPVVDGRLALTISQNHHGNWGGPEQVEVRMPQCLARAIYQALGESLGEAKQERAA